MNQIWFHQQTFHLAFISYNDHKSQSYEHQSKIAAKHSEKPINTNICYEYATTYLLINHLFYTYTSLEKIIPSMFSILLVMKSRDFEAFKKG